MSPLKVSDLKPGDVVRVDLSILRHDNYHATVQLQGGRRTHIDNDDLAAGNAELVVRPRPVRKGDQIKNSLGEPRTFLAVLNGRAYVVTPDGNVLDDAKSHAGDEWSHADGSPIDWEASE